MLVPIIDDALARAFGELRAHLERREQRDHRRRQRGHRDRCERADGALAAEHVRAPGCDRGRGRRLRRSRGAAVRARPEPGHGRATTPWTAARNGTGPAAASATTTSTPPARSPSPPARRPKSCAWTSLTAPTVEPLEFFMFGLEHAHERDHREDERAHLHRRRHDRAAPAEHRRDTGCPDHREREQPAVHRHWHLLGRRRAYRSDDVGDLGVGERGGGHHQHQWPRARRQRRHEHDLRDGRSG